MHIIVDNENKQLEFNRIWKECWKDKEDAASVDAQQYIIYAGNQPAGILEFKPFSEEVNQVFPFSDDERVSKNIDSVYEIKIGVLKEFQGFRGKDVLPEMVSVIVKFLTGNNASCGISLIDPPLHFVLGTIFKLPINKMGKKFKNQGEEVLPVCIYGLTANKH